MSQDRRAAIASRCESLGRNCEFGFVQRQFGLEPISLLRWAGSDLAGLTLGFRQRFRRLADTLTWQPEPAESPPEHQHWVVRCAAYGIEFHTPDMIQKSPERAAQDARPRLRWLASKLLDDIANCERVFVYSSRELGSPAEAMPLVDAIRVSGPAPIVIVAPGTDESISEIGADIGEGLYGARLPTLTHMHGAFGADLVAWGRLFDSLGSVIDR
jgi:hypothetical protein